MIVDVSHVAELAPAGVSVLLAVAGHARRRSVQLVLHDPSPVLTHALARSHAGRALMLLQTTSASTDGSVPAPESPHTGKAACDREDASDA